MRPFVSVLFLVSAALTAPAQAQVLVLGESPAARCYEHAAAGRTDRGALADCDRALETVSVQRHDRAATHINRGVILMRRGNSEAALADYDSAEQSGLSDQAALALNRSSALIRLSRFSEAVEQTELVIGLGDRNLAEAWFNRGVAMEFMGEIETAYRSYRRALDLRPDWSLPAQEMARFTVQTNS